MDGHCFMHSILSAIQLQAIATNAFSGLNMSQLISMIKNAAVLNENRYLQFFVGMSMVHFFDKLDSYFEHKLYDSYPIDLIPLITSNALQVDVGIITKDTSGVHSYRWVHWDKNDADAVLVYKYGDHYDGLAPIGQNPAIGNNNLITSRPRAYPVIQNYSFQVGNKMPESDHNPVTFSIKLNSPVENIAKSTHTWTPVYKYTWNQDGLDKLDHVLNDNTSENSKEVFYTSVLLNANVDTVATSFTEYFGQACYRIYGIKRVNQKRQSDPNWFDAESRAKRNEAIKAGAHVESDADRDTLVATCKQYRSLKQQKKRRSVKNVRRK